jgi:hypothetical protein
VNKAATIDWLRKWNVLYDTSYDNEVSKYRGRKSLGLNELEVIYWWKYRGLWPAKKIRALRSHVADRLARDWTRRALACPDDLGALCIAGLLAGAGPGGASAVLMAAAPIRFTVMDTRAIKSLAFLGRWSIRRPGLRRVLSTLARLSRSVPEAGQVVRDGPSRGRSCVARSRREAVTLSCGEPTRRRPEAHARSRPSVAPPQLRFGSAAANSARAPTTRRSSWGSSRASVAKKRA